MISIACSPPRGNSLASRDNHDPLKDNIAGLVATQKNKAEWLDANACAIDNAPNVSREPELEPGDCAIEPSKCLDNCDSGNGDACWALGVLIQQNGEMDNSVAEALFKKSCRLGISSGCTNAAATNMYREAGEASACVAQSFEYSCRQSDPWGCTMHGRVLAESGDLAAARVALDRACELSDNDIAEACTSAKEIREQIDKSAKR
jgi:hypothetical protein